MMRRMARFIGAMTVWTVLGSPLAAMLVCCNLVSESNPPSGSGSKPQTTIPTAPAAGTQQTEYLYASWTNTAATSDGQALKASALPVYAADPAKAYRQEIYPRIKRPGGAGIVLFIEGERRGRTPDGAGQRGFNQYIPWNWPKRLLGDARQRTALRQLLVDFPSLKLGIWWSSLEGDTANGMRTLDVDVPADRQIVEANLKALYEFCRVGSSKSRLALVGNDSGAMAWAQHCKLAAWMKAEMPGCNLVVEGPVPVTDDPVTHWQACTLWSAFVEQPSRPELAIPPAQRGQVVRLLMVQDYTDKIKLAPWVKPTANDRARTLASLRQCVTQGMTPVSQGSWLDDICREAQRSGAGRQ